MMTSRKALLPLSLSIALTACGGGGGGGSNATPEVSPPAATPQLQQVDGQLIAPVLPTLGAAIASGGMRQVYRRGGSTLGALATEDCDSIPTGYTALDSVAVEALDASSGVLTTFTTDECGAFSISLPDGVATLRAVQAGYEPLAVDVEVFTDADQGALASLLPEGAGYELTTLQFLGDNQVAATVVDSVTRRAVIGLPATSFELLLNGSVQSIAKISSVAATSTAASVVLVLDASGSMGRRVTESLDKIDLASLAAHEFIDGKSPDDETGLVVFDSQVFPITNTFLENNIPMQNSGGAPVPWNYGDTGFVTSDIPLHRMADAYNRQSVFYGRRSGIPLHPVSGDVLTADRTPFGGATALWDACIAGLEQLITGAGNGRQLIVAMTDGRNNSSISDRSCP